PAAAATVSGVIGALLLGLLAMFSARPGVKKKTSETDGGGTLQPLPASSRQPSRRSSPAPARSRAVWPLFQMHSVLPLLTCTHHALDPGRTEQSCRSPASFPTSIIGSASSWRWFWSRCPRHSPHRLQS